MNPSKVLSPFLLSWCVRKNGPDVLMTDTASSVVMKYSCSPEFSGGPRRNIWKVCAPPLQYGAPLWYLWTFRTRFSQQTHVSVGATRWQHPCRLSRDISPTVHQSNHYTAILPGKHLSRHRYGPARIRMLWWKLLLTIMFCMWNIKTTQLCGGTCCSVE